jgi:predicted anti-sigma-YlaC factor YlaD
MKTCLKVTEGIERKHFDRITLSDRIRIHLHLKICPNCDQYAKDSKSLDRMLSASFQRLPKVQFSPEEKQALINQIAL